MPGGTGSWEAVWQPPRIPGARRSPRRHHRLPSGSAPLAGRWDVRGLRQDREADRARGLAWRLPPMWPRLIANPACHRRFPKVRQRPDAERLLAEQVIRHGHRTDPRQTNLKDFCQRALIGPAARSSTATGCWNVCASPFPDRPSKGGREADSTAGTCRSYRGFQLQLDRCALPFQRLIILLLEPRHWRR
jgi:hypothetical protein